MRAFDVRAIEPLESDELLLDEGDLYQPVAESAEAPLVLDDVLAQIGPDSRIVRLFDPAKMPTAGELSARIERHLDGRPGDSQSADAAQALHEALAQLRRNVR